MLNDGFLKNHRWKYIIVYDTKHPCEMAIQSCTNVGPRISGIQSLTWPATGKMLDM